MSPEYKVTLDERLFDVEVKMLDEGGVLVVKVGDQSFTMKSTSAEDDSWIVNDLTTDYSVKILKRAGKSVTLEINGEERELDWERVRKVEAVKKNALFPVQELEYWIFQEADSQEWVFLYCP